MTRQLPGIPALRCVGCGGRRFIPLTFPRFGEAQRSATVRPSAKCVTCGLCYVGTFTRQATPCLASGTPTAVLELLAEVEPVSRPA